MKLGLSLSGGGYRASAYHLGTLSKLNSLRLLPAVDVISTISGGSITGACYGINTLPYEEFHQELYQKLNNKNVIKQLLLSWVFLRTALIILVFAASATYVLFTPYPWISPFLVGLLIFLLLKFQFRIFPASQQIERIYDDFFYCKKTLSHLHTHPHVVIGATNIQTGRPFTFSKSWMQDTTYQYLKDHDVVTPVTFIPQTFPIARAVIASSCVPFAFTPIKIDKSFFANPTRDFKRVNPQLVDGGVFDNQGIHKIMQKGRWACDIIITSDAGNKMDFQTHSNNTISLLTRVVDIFMARIKNLQIIQDVYANATLAKKEIAYISLGWDLDECIPGFIDNLEKKQITQQVIDMHQLKPEWVETPNEYRTEITQYLKIQTHYDLIPQLTKTELQIARSVSTNLTPLSKAQLDALIKHASSLTELQLKLYCPTLFIPDSDKLN